MNIGMVVVCYNGYGRFVPQLLKSIKGIKQLTIVAMGKNHGLKKINTNIEQLNVIYLKKMVSMGEARNVGIRATHAEWILYFSIDDILLPNAVKEIEKKQSKSVVFLQLEERKEDRIRKHHTFLPNDERIVNWQRYYMIPGYVVFKRGVWEQNPYIDSEFPNLPFIFQSYKAGYEFGKTDKICAAYIRRKDSHNRKMIKENRIEEAIQLIDNYV